MNYHELVFSVGLFTLFHILALSRKLRSKISINGIVMPIIHNTGVSSIIEIDVYLIHKAKYHFSEFFHLVNSRFRYDFFWLFMFEMSCQQKLYYIPTSKNDIKYAEIR
jgi:hypothetical protein